MAASARTRAAALVAGIALLAGGAVVGTSVTDGNLQASADRTCPDLQNAAKVAAAEGLLARKGAVRRDQLRAALDTTVPCPDSTPPPSPSPGPTDPHPPTGEPTPTTPPPTPETPTQGFPTADTTGVPDGVALTPSGGLTVTKDGTVLDGLHIRGALKVLADNVTVRRSRIESTSLYPVQQDSSNSGLLIEDSEIDGGGVASVAVLKGNYTLRRVEVRNVKDGPRIEGDNVTIEDCLIHLLTRVEGGHHDTLQIRKGVDVVIRHNTLQAYRSDTDDPMNAAVQVGSFVGPVDRVLIERNWLDGGNNTINGGAPGITIRGNVFGPHARFKLIGSLNGAIWESNVRSDGKAA